MNLLTSVVNFNNSKLYFSKYELNKILMCYYMGVSKGNWKDYAINFGKQKTSFYMFKHSLSSPHCVLTKIKKNKKNIISFDLQISNFKKSKFSKIDELIPLIKRTEFKII